MALTWTMTLKDAMSGAASKAARAVDKLTTSLRSADKESSKTTANPYAGVTASAQRAGRAVDQLNAKMAKSKSGGTFGTDNGGKMQGVGAGMAGMGGKVGAAGLVGGLATVYGGALGGIVGLGSLIYDAQSFKNSTAFAFEQILGSKSAAEAAMATASKTANMVGADLRTSMSAMNSLMAQGFDVSFADEIVRAMADLKTINPAANLEGITRAISQIKTTGRLQGDELMQLAEAGVNVNKVYEQIGKTMGLVEGKKNKKGQAQSIAEQVRALQEAGQITDKTAIDAIMSSIKTQVGGKEFGATAAAKMEGTLGGALIRANNLKETFLSSIKIDWSPATSALDRIMGVLQSPAGEAFSAKISAGLNRMLGLLDNVTAEDMTSFLDNAGDAFTAFTEQVVVWGGRIDWVVDKINWLASSFKNLTGDSVFDFMSLDNMWITLKEKFSSSGIQQWADEVGTSFSESISGIGDSVSEAASGIGSGIVDGIVGGITGGAGAIADAATAAAKSALASAKSFLGIKSPSKLFRDQVGGQIARGMALGIEGGTPQVRDSSQRMGEQAFNGGQRLSSAITNNTSSSRNNTAILNQGGGDDDGAASAMAIRALSDQLRGMNAAGA
ncbi:MAG: hypothetical protein ACRCU1_03450 [Alsobacter sp.]